MAASAGAVRAGAAYVEIFATDSKFQQAMTRVRTSISTIGQQVRRAGTGTFLTGAALGAPLLLAMRSAANFENALADARASAGLTAGEVDKIRAKSLELSKAGLGGPAAIAQAFTALVKAGMPLEQAMGGAAEAVIQFASNAGIDVTQAAETASDAMNVFGVTSTQATDILKAAADSSSTSVQAMVMAFSQSSAVAGMANQSMDTLAASLAILANNGVKGSDAGTSIKTMLLRLAAPADEAARMLQSVGLSANSFRGADGNMLPLANVLDILNASLTNLDQGQRDQALLKIFGSDAIRAGTILLRSGSEGLASMGQAMAASGTNADAYRIKMSGITGAMQTVTSATERLQITVATALGPAFQSAAQSMAGFMDFLGRIATDFPGLVTAAAGLSVGLVAVGAASIAIGTSLQSLGVIIGVTQKAMALFAANPVVIAGLGAAAIAIGGIGLALRQIWPDFKQTTDEYLKMLGLMSGTSPGQSGKLIESRDIAPKLTESGQVRLARVVERQQFGENVDIPAEFKRVISDDMERVRADATLSQAARTKQLFEMAQLISALDAQMRAGAAAAAQPPATAGGTAGVGKAAAGGGPTDAQIEAAARVRDENMTPSQRVDAERNRLLELLNAKALNEEDFLKAVNRLEEDANKEQADAAKQRAKDLQDKAQQLRDEMATPEEKLRARIQEIQSLPLDPDTRQRAIERAKSDAVEAMTARGSDSRGIVSAGTFGDASMIGVGPELVDPARQTAENTRRIADGIASMAMAAGQPPVQAGAPVQMPLPGVGAQVAAPRAEEVRRAAEGGMAAAADSMTLSQTMRTTQAQVVAAIGRTTEAVQSTLATLEQIATNTTNMGAAFL